MRRLHRAPHRRVTLQGHVFETDRALLHDFLMSSTLTMNARHARGAGLDGLGLGTKSMTIFAFGYGFDGTYRTLLQYYYRTLVRSGHALRSSHLPYSWLDIRVLED